MRYNIIKYMIILTVAAAFAVSYFAAGVAGRIYTHCDRAVSAESAERMTVPDAETSLSSDAAGVGDGSRETFCIALIALAVIIVALIAVFLRRR